MFDEDYEVLLADSVESKALHYNLRYQVYCDETNFENPDNFPNEMEYDEYDEDSVHFIVRSKLNNEWVAAMRVVMKPLDELPLKKHGLIEKTFDESAFNETAEISRLCVLSAVRRKANLSKPKNPACSGEISQLNKNPIDLDDRRREPEIMLGLLRAAYWYCLDHGKKFCFFLAAPSLARILNRIALKIESIGPGSQFRGLRVPYCCDLTTFLDDVPQKSQVVYEMFSQQNCYRSFDRWQRSTVSTKVAALA